MEVEAFASPEGGFAYNDRLAEKRQDASEEYVQKTLKDTKVDADVDARYTAQDWEGFQQLVQASNIQDKDVILRVLSMYKDPEEREQQIRNMIPKDAVTALMFAKGIRPDQRSIMPSAFMMENRLRAMGIERKTKTVFEYVATVVAPEKLVKVKEQQETV